MLTLKTGGSPDRIGRLRWGSQLMYPTHESRDVTTAAGAQGTQVARLNFVDDPIVPERPYPGTAAHVMGIPVRKNNDVARTQFGPLSID
jgi:hypothetical protein